jgi:hypothetical protein
MPQQDEPAMDVDVEVMRELLLTLEPRQLSPRSTVVLCLDDEARDLGLDAGVVAAGLNTLLELDYIDGGGEDEGGFWLFRKLTRKGLKFVRAARVPRDWERMKRHYAGLEPIR